MSGKASNRGRPAFADVVKEVKAAVPISASEVWVPLHPIEDGSWQTSDRVRWRLHRELSSAGTVRERLASPAMRVLWVAGPEAREISASDASAAWVPVEGAFKQQYRRGGEPKVQIDGAEFRDDAGDALLIIEVNC